jgi:hypothetical protein
MIPRSWPWLVAAAIALISGAFWLYMLEFGCGQSEAPLAGTPRGEYCNIATANALLLIAWIGPPIALIVFGASRRRPRIADYAPVIVAALMLAPLMALLVIVLPRA